MANFMARLEGMLADNPKVMNVSSALATSFPLVIDDLNDFNFDCLSGLSLVYDKLTSGKTRTLVKGCLGDPGRCVLESKPSPNPIVCFSLFPILC